MKIFWSHTIEGERVSFDGIPFTVAAIHKLHCQFGNHYYKEHLSKSSRIKLQGTRKIGCPAHIHIHKLHLYPTFSVSNDVVAGLGSRKFKELRAKKLGELREALTKTSKVDFHWVSYGIKGWRDQILSLRSESRLNFLYLYLYNGHLLHRRRKGGLRVLEYPQLLQSLHRIVPPYKNVS